MWSVVHMAPISRPRSSEASSSLPTASFSPWRHASRSSMASKPWNVWGRLASSPHRAWYRKLARSRCCSSRQEGWRKQSG